MPLIPRRRYGIMEDMDPNATEFHRRRDGAILGGVCTGLATYFGSTPNIVRTVFLITFFGLSGVSLPIYVVLWAIIPADSPRDKAKNHWVTWAFWSLGLGLSALALTGVLSAELPLDISIGTALITIGGLLMSTPKPVPQPSTPTYAPGQVIKNERTGEINP